MNEEENKNLYRSILEQCDMQHFPLRFCHSVYEQICLLKIYSEVTLFSGRWKSGDVDVLSQDRVVHRVNVPALGHRFERLQNVNFDKVKGV